MLPIPQKSTVMIDLSYDMGLGDTVLRVGALNIFQNNSRELYVISNRPKVLTMGGIKDVVTYDQVEEILPNVAHIVLAPSWSRSSADYWRQHTNENITLKFVTGILDCSYKRDCENVLFEFNINHPYMNRVELNFLDQIRRGTEFEFDAMDIIPGVNYTQAMKLKSDKRYNFAIPKKILAIGDNASKVDKCWPMYFELVRVITTDA